MRFACWITTATRAHTHSDYVIFLLYHGDSGFVNAPRSYVIRALSVLLSSLAFIQSLPKGLEVTLLNKFILNFTCNIFGEINMLYAL